MVNDKVANIEELERDEALTPLSDFPFDVTSKRVKFPSNLDQSPFAASPVTLETATDALNSS